MNRAQRRKAVSKRISDKELTTLEQLCVAEDIAKGIEIGIEHAVNSYSAAVAYVMRYKMGYGEKKCITTMRQVQNIFDDIGSGKLNLDEIKKDLARDVGIIIK